MEREELLDQLDLKRLTENTLTDLVALRKEVSEVVHLGYARDRQEMECVLEHRRAPGKRGRPDDRRDFGLGAKHADER